MEQLEDKGCQQVYEGEIPLAEKPNMECVPLKTKEEFQAALENPSLWAGNNIAEYHRVVEKVKDLCGKTARFSKAYYHGEPIGTATIFTT